MLRFDPKRIDEARGEMTLRVLASALGVTEQTLKNWRSGRTAMNVADLARLAEALHKPITFFFVKAA